MIYNFTKAAIDNIAHNVPDTIDVGVVSLKAAIDSAIFKYHGLLEGKKVPEINIKIQGYPMTKNRFVSNYDVITGTGPMYLFMPTMVIFGLVVSEIAREK